MRVLVAPLNYSHRQTGQLDAFRHVFGAGNVREFDFMNLSRQGDNANAHLLAAALEFRPDWIWLQVQGSNIIHGAMLDRIRAELPHCFISHWMGDLRTEVPEDLAAICRATHATLLSNADPDQWALYRRAGARRIHYVQIGLDWDDDVAAPDMPPPFEVPAVVFCGGHYAHAASFGAGTAQRVSAIRRLMAEGIDVGVVGTGWPGDIRVVGECHVKAQVHVYRRAKVALSINHFNDIRRYYSDRHLIAMASGTPVVARYIPELEVEFRNAIDCFMWHAEGDLVAYVRMLLDDDDRRAEMGTTGQQRVLAEHTWRHRIACLAPRITQWREEGRL